MQLQKLAKHIERARAHRLGVDIVVLVVLLMALLIYTASCNNISSAVCITADGICCLVALLVSVNCTREPDKDTSMHIFTTVAWLFFGYTLADLLGWITLEERCNLLQYLADASEILIGYAATMVFTRYIRELTGFPNKFMRILYYAIFVITILLAVCLLITLPFGLVFKVVNGVYIRGPFHIPFHTFPTVVLIIDLIAIIHSNKLSLHEKISLSTYCAAPLVALPVQLLNYGVTSIAVSMLMSLVIIYNNIFLQRSKMLIQRDNELTQNRMQMMVSQIQPHFLYNTLTSIANICEKDPRAARQAIVDFSDYLRVNLDSLKCQQNVPFVKELEHCHTYLNFEKMRFEDELTILYDIQVTDFMIPILSVQPMVENAVKHGICEKEGGGTVRLSTCRDGGTIRIVIEDDGVGFDLDAMPQDTSRQHIGLENVRYRIAQMCGGTVQAESAPGTGTKITICLPEKEETA